MLEILVSGFSILVGSVYFVLKWKVSLVVGVKEKLAAVFFIGEVLMLLLLLMWKFVWKSLMNAKLIFRLKNCIR